MCSTNFKRNKERELEQEELQPKRSPIVELSPGGGSLVLHTIDSFALSTEPLCWVPKENALWIQRLLGGLFHCQIISSCFITVDLCVSF